MPSDPDSSRHLPNLDSDSQPPPNFDLDSQPPPNFDSDSQPPPNFDSESQPPPSFDSESQPLPNLDSDLLPRYIDKRLDSLTCSSPYNYTMAGQSATVMAYTHLLFTLLFLISGLASMPFISLCTGGGLFVGTLALSTGVSLLLNTYFRRGFPLHEPLPEDDPQAPFRWRLTVYYFLNFALPLLFGIIFALVLRSSIANSCNFIPTGCICNQTASNPPLHTPGHTLKPTETAL
jgi:hypothetical protein